MAAQYPGWNLGYDKGSIYAEWHHGDSREETWLTIPHPMCAEHAEDPHASAQAFFEHFGHGEQLILVNGYKDYIEYDSVYSVWGRMCAVETADRFEISATIQDSYHDGGGSFEDSAALVFAPGVMPPETLETGDTIEGMKIPQNEGFWTADETLYLLNPLHLEGVFSFQETVKSEEYAGSGFVTRSIG